jgi:hypothetical protein
LINITHDYEDDEEASRTSGKNTVLFDSAGPDGDSKSTAGQGSSRRRATDDTGADFAASSTEEEESDEEAQLEYEKRRRERKGKYRADEQV